MQNHSKMLEFPGLYSNKACNVWHTKGQFVLNSYLVHLQNLLSCSFDIFLWFLTLNCKMEVFMRKTLWLSYIVKHMEVGMQPVESLPCIKLSQSYFDNLISQLNLLYWMRKYFLWLKRKDFLCYILRFFPLIPRFCCIVKMHRTSRLRSP